MNHTQENSPIIGIDLGTSNCCIALWSTQNTNKQRIEIVRNAQGDRTTPSVISLREDASVVVGAPARRQAVMNPRDTISEVKRLVGLPFYSPEVSAARAILPYEIFRSENGDAWVKACGRTLSPQEVQAYILEELVRSASNFLGKKVDRAVITVPAFYDETQRQAVRDASAIAGLTVARILSEPTAAALAYGYSDLDLRTIAVVDLGGGTLDVTIMKIDRGKFKVLATDGDNTLGGADFDRTLANHFAANIQETHGLDVRPDPIAMQRLLTEAEVAKKILSERDSAEIQLPYLAQKGATTINFSYVLNKEEYEEIVTPLVERITTPCSRAVTQAGLRASQLDDVILIGGMTRSPIVNKQIGKLFQRKPLLRINPDEAVAMGAALLGASLSGFIDDIQFSDVVPRTIGLSAAGDSYVPLIKKSSLLPALCRKAFATTRDNQESFELEILQGEATIASDNRRLLQISISPITAGPAGEVIVEIGIKMDNDGSLSVQAKERGSNVEKNVTIEASSGLRKDALQALCQAHSAERGPGHTGGGSVEKLGGFSIVMSGAKPATQPRIKETPSPAAKRGSTAQLPPGNVKFNNPPESQRAATTNTQQLPLVKRPDTAKPEESRRPRPETSLHPESSIPWLWIGLAIIGIGAGAAFYFFR